MEVSEQIPQRIGLRGSVDDQMDLQTACFDLGDVGVDLGTRFGVAFFVDDDGETTVRGGKERGLAQKKRCEEHFFQKMHVVGRV